jgi:hypothetical protein
LTAPSLAAVLQKSEDAMPKNTQLLWIAEAEARRFQEFTRIQHAISESHVSVVSAMRGSARLNRWRRLIARISPVVEDLQTVPIDIGATEEANTWESTGNTVPARSVLAGLVETSFDAQRG